jgi:hypothetical protein
VRHGMFVMVSTPRSGGRRRVRRHELRRRAALDARWTSAKCEPGAEGSGWCFSMRAGQADAGPCRGNGAYRRFLVDVDLQLLAAIFGDGCLGQRARTREEHGEIA